MARDHYRQFIEEAFVDPIRSVLIVDDDYPTYAEILDSQSGDDTSRRKTWHTDPGRIQRIIRRFRERTPPLLVDIHDGANISVGGEVTVAKHLHQSDLLVLDYQLEAGEQAGGTRAIGILRSLMSNAHFNLVIVYTKKEIDSVFEEVLWGLINPSPGRLSENETQDAEQLLEKGEDKLDGFSSHISESIGSAQYFHSRLHKESYLRTMAKGEQPYSEFKDECDKAEWNHEERRLILRYYLDKVEQDHRGVIVGDLPDADSLIWQEDHRQLSVGRIKWIKSDSVFIAFSQKTDDDDLLSELQSALSDWNPRPSRLLLTKLRAEMDEHGIAAQGQALSSHHALAYWYDRLLRTDNEPECRWRISESVSRHSDRLISGILPRVEGFVARLIESERKVSGGDIEQISKDHFGVDLSKDESRKQAALEHNAFVCSMKPEGWHLTTGHIFSISGDEYWLCLSPACDMEPSQISKWNRETFGERRLPFIAVRLRSVSKKKSLVDVHSNRHVFLLLDGKIKRFCFNDPSGDSSAPHWSLFYAEERGEFSSDDLRFFVSRMEQKDTQLISKRYEATVVSQIRYEYALNLIQKLGVSLTRIGLDFVDGQAYP